jgi:prepilin-type processing-associated H-X9-DG protein
MRKRISLTVVAALTAGVLTSVATGPAANAHMGIVNSTTATNAPTANMSSGVPTGFYVAESLSTSGAAVAANFSTAGAGSVASAKSLGLLTKDATSATAQTATMLTSGTLSLYYLANTATVTALTATGGTFGVGSTSSIGITPTMNQTRTTALFGAVATGVGQLWTAPSTAGTYTIGAYYHGNGAVPTLTTPAGTLFGQITVTVVAASAGGSYNAGNSFCAISNAAASFTQANNTDSTAATINGGSMYINFALNDAYNNDLAEGNLVITATGGANVAYADGSAVVAGTSGTAVAYDEGAGDSIRVTQGTADAPTSSTVTISYNGTVVCTKTVGFAGAPTKVAVTVLETQALSTSAGKSDFLADGYARAGLFTVLLTDAAGNQVQAAAGDNGTTTIGTFSANAASLAGQTIVSALSVTSAATQTSTTLPGRVSTGTYTCGANAGEVKTAKLDFTISATGKVITSDAFTIRCAGAPYSYTASFDKASYVQGDLATLTVKFLDSKGFAANSVSGTGGWTSVTPMLTNVSTTGAAAALGTTGSKTYQYTVGTAGGMTAGTYTSIIDFTTLTGAETAVKATPTYKLSAASTDVAFSEILKSVVALIASINKQIQALQKLILKR